MEAMRPEEEGGGGGGAGLTEPRVLRTAAYLEKRWSQLIMSGTSRLYLSHSFGSGRAPVCHLRDVLPLFYCLPKGRQDGRSIKYLLRGTTRGFALVSYEEQKCRQGRG